MVKNVEKAIYDLLEFQPGFPRNVKLYYSNCYTRHQARQERKRANDAPFFTEAYLYELLGKEDARTLLALVNRVKKAAKGEIDENPNPSSSVGIR